MEKFLSILREKFPKANIIGYWKKSDYYVFNIAVPSDYAGCSQFRVTADGKITGTNPIRDDLPYSEMKKLNIR